MSLYGALFSGVSGLNAQSNKIGVISDNIANVNTVGYKGTVGSFGTLVTTSGINTLYSPGGVLSGSTQQVSKQGLLQSTSSATDIAISGSGFFVVNSSGEGTGQVSYTRAGSFTQDSTGNFRNTSGFYLMAWPLDRNGNLPGAPGNLNTTSAANLSSLSVVNVENLTGTAASTSSVSVGANLQASQVPYAGAGATVTMDSTDTLNQNLKAKDIIVPNTSVNLMAEDDAFDITTNGVTYSYSYGGFTYGRSITTGANGDSGAAVNPGRPFDSNGEILDAASTSASFLAITGVSSFSEDALSFSITTNTTGVVNFTYSVGAPNAQLGQFNNLTNLAEAINEVNGLSARVVNDRLYISPTDSNEAIAFDNGDDVGADGIDWVGELGIADTTSGSNRFTTMEGLAKIINATTGLTATINNPLSNATVDLNIDDPLATVQFEDQSGNTGSVLAALGLMPSIGAGPFTAQDTGSLGPAYDPTDPDFNMSGGNIAAQFSRPATIYDGLGTGHNLNISFIKTGTNKWAVEVYAVPASDITSTLAPGQITYGNVEFNGDGSLRSVDFTPSGAVTLQWTNGATPSSVEFDWGTAGSPFGTANATAIGKTDGLSQFNSAYNVNFVNQNGAPVGQLTGVAITEEGIIVASYSNGETQDLFKIPLASFANPDQLLSTTGNTFIQTSASGEVNLREAGTSGVGNISSGSLEASNVELADQLTDMIVAQRAYQANTKVISTADTLLNDLNQILR